MEYPKLCGAHWCLSLPERQLKLVAYGVTVFFSVREVVIVRTESVPSQASKRNIEALINTYTCKISMTFFSVLFCCVEEGPSGLCFILSGFALSVHLKLVSC